MNVSHSDKNVDCGEPFKLGGLHFHFKLPDFLLTLIDVPPPIEDIRNAYTARDATLYRVLEGHQKGHKLDAAAKETKALIDEKEKQMEILEHEVMELKASRNETLAESAEIYAMCKQGTEEMQGFHLKVLELHQGGQTWTPPQVTRNAWDKFNGIYERAAAASQASNAVVNNQKKRGRAQQDDHTSGAVRVKKPRATKRPKAAATSSATDASKAPVPTAEEEAAMTSELSRVYNLGDKCFHNPVNARFMHMNDRVKTNYRGGKRAERVAIWQSYPELVSKHGPEPPLGWQRDFQVPENWKSGEDLPIDWYYTPGIKGTYDLPLWHHLCVAENQRIPIGSQYKDIECKLVADGWTREVVVAEDGSQKSTGNLLPPWDDTVNVAAWPRDDHSIPEPSNSRSQKRYTGPFQQSEKYVSPYGPATTSTAVAENELVPQFDGAGYINGANATMPEDAFLSQFGDGQDNQMFSSGNDMAQEIECNNKFTNYEIEDLMSYAPTDDMTQSSEFTDISTTNLVIDANGYSSASASNTGIGQDEDCHTPCIDDVPALMCDASYPELDFDDEECPDTPFDSFFNDQFVDTVACYDADIM